MDHNLNPREVEILVVGEAGIEPTTPGLEGVGATLRQRPDTAPLLAGTAGITNNVILLYRGSSAQNSKVATCAVPVAACRRTI
jgi:hypothetical protein